MVVVKCMKNALCPLPVLVDQFKDGTALILIAALGAADLSGSIQVTRGA